METLDQAAQRPQRPICRASLFRLLKGVLYRDGDAGLVECLAEAAGARARLCTVLGLELVLDEAEGYAFLRSRTEGDEETTTRRNCRVLIARRPLSFPVSLLLALLAKKLAEFDAGGGDTRLVLTRDQIVEMIRVFFPDRQQRGQAHRSDRDAYQQNSGTGIPAPAETGADNGEAGRHSKCGAY